MIYAILLHAIITTGTCGFIEIFLFPFFNDYTLITCLKTTYINIVASMCTFYGRYLHLHNIKFN